MSDVMMYFLLLIFYFLPNSICFFLSILVLNFCLNSILHLKLCEFNLQLSYFVLLDVLTFLFSNEYFAQYFSQLFGSFIIFMDQYIKRKKKIDVPEPIKQSTQQINLRQSKNQLSDLTLKLKYIQQRVDVVKQTLKGLEILRSEKQKQSNNRLLDEASMQKSLIKNQIPNRNTSTTNTIISQSKKLEGAEGMVDQRDATTIERQNVNFVDEKLQQPGKRVGRKRKTRI